ncbi:MAG: hypothetical protein M3N93_00560, partial [Acidobacteriota bacterium]|nr:hypothetical protein [Acidobacteriota bacterium]
LVGVIEGAEQVVVKGGDRRIDAQFGGGHTSTNGGVTGDHSSTLTALTIALTLEEPNSLDVPGASARYRVYLEQTDKNNGVQFYMDGNGFGVGSRLKITQASSDAIYETMARGLVQIMGNALKIPYFQCDQNFRSDTTLESRVRQDFGSLTDMQLEQKLQRFMIVDGSKIGRLLGPLQPADRTLLNAEMQHRKLPVDRNGMVELAMQFWRGIDYFGGANRMEGIYVQNDLVARQRMEAEATQRAALGIDPREFGFAPGINILVIDLSRVKRPDMLKEISATLQKCHTCGEVRWHPQKPIVGINTAMKESEIQYLLNSTRFPFEFVWSHAQSPQVLVVPKLGTSQQTGGISIK